MKTKELTSIMCFHFQEVKGVFSLKLLLKNVICSPT